MEPITQKNWWKNQNIVLENKEVARKDVITLIHDQSGIYHNYHQIFRLKNRILEKYINNTKNCYKYINSNVEFIKAFNEHAVFESDSENRFQRVYISIEYTSRTI